MKIVSSEIKASASLLLFAMVLTSLVENGQAYFGYQGRRLGWSQQWEGQRKLCKDETYSMSIYADSHMYLIAAPSETAAAMGCLPLAFHDGQFNKLVDMLDTTNEENAAMLENSYPLHAQVKMSKLAGAFANADSVSADGTPDDYDVVTNNCGRFILSFGALLGISAHNTDAMNYVINQLVDSHVIAEMARKSKNVDALGLTPDGLKDDHTVIADLVEKTVSEQALF